MVEIWKMEGNPNEVALATEIRASVIQTITLLNKYYSVHNPGLEQILILGLGRLLSQKLQASWWIDRSSLNPSDWEEEVKRLVSQEEVDLFLN